MQHNYSERDRSQGRRRRRTAGLIPDGVTRSTLSCDSSLRAAGCLPSEGKAIYPSLAKPETPLKCRSASIGLAVSASRSRRSIAVRSGVVVPAGQRSRSRGRQAQTIKQDEQFTHNLGLDQVLLLF